MSVGDREADIYELFELAERLSSSFLVRAFHNRKVSEEAKVWDFVEEEKPAGRMKVSAKGKDKKTREAELEIRFREVNILNPKVERDKEEIPLWAIWAREVSPTGAERALDWKLLTNTEVRDFEHAREKIEWYTIRFGIETFHKILKSGRRSEDKRLGSLDRLERCLAVDMITAWRVMYLTMLGRERPEVDSDLFFNEQEMDKSLYVKKEGFIPLPIHSM